MTKPARKEPYTLNVDDLEIVVTKKRIKNVNLRIKPPDGRIEVSAPYRTSDAFIAGFVRTKHAWIVSQQKRIAASPSSLAEAATQKERNEWRTIVEALTPVLINKWEPIMGVHAEKIVYRDMTSRWGSCQPSTGRICINIRLALYPPECLEYVVVHELCHLIERGHGPAFQAAMTRFLPDWKKRRARLR